MFILSRLRTEPMGCEHLADVDRMHRDPQFMEFLGGVRNHRATSDYIAFMHTYACDGTSTRQHNGPGGNQEVWHYHLHVFPRYEGDGLYGASRRLTTPEERAPYADRLRANLSS